MDITNTIPEAANYTPDHPGPWVVTVAIADRAYGGPEEGGWWYDGDITLAKPRVAMLPKVILLNASGDVGVWAGS